jgi:hypothetical protein
VIGMAIGPIWDGNRPRSMTPNECNGLLEMPGISSNLPVRPAQILAPRGTEHDARRLGFGKPLFDGPVATHLPGREIAEAHAQPQGRVPGDRAAKANFDVVGMRPKSKKVNGHDDTVDQGRRDYLNPKTSSAGSTSPR